MRSDVAQPDSQHLPHGGQDGVGALSVTAASRTWKSLPGPKRHLIRGILPEYRRDPLGFLSACAREYGDIVPLRAGPRRGVLINRPEYIEYVLVTNSQNFARHYVARLNRLLMGNGLLSSGGELWLRQRRLAQPAFHRERISAYASAMTAYTEQMLDVWRDGEVRDVHQAMMRVTLQIVSSVLFGADAAGEVRKVAAAAAIVQQTFAARLNSTILPPDILPTPANLRLRVAVRRLDGIVYRVIEERRAGREQADDLLSLFLRAQDEDGTRMTNKQLRDEVMTLFLAGHETTALALTWTLFLLSQHPEVEARLLTEIDAVLGGRNPTAADRSQLGYTERVVMEAVRLYPPAWGLIRDAMKDCSMDGYRIEAGMYVAMSQWVMHRDPRYFEQPDRFDPDRWETEAARHRPKFAYFPFGGGGHLCIGSSFAMIEAILLLAMIVQRYHLSLVPDHPVVPQPALTLRPAHGMRMVLHQR